MLVRFNQNLGLLDIRLVKDKTGHELNPADCKAGCTTDLPARAAELLGSKYKSLFEPVNVKGEAKKPEITAPSK